MKLEFPAPFWRDPPFSCLVADSGPLYPLADIMTLIGCDERAVWSAIAARGAHHRLHFPEGEPCVDGDDLDALLNAIGGTAPARQFLREKVFPIVDRLSLNQGDWRPQEAGTAQPIPTRLS